MDQTVQTVLDYVIAFLSSGIVATVLGVIGKAIINARTTVKLKKYSKLTEADRQAIAADVQSGVRTALIGGVTVDMDAQIDKATSRRITAIEQSQNAIIEQMNQLMFGQRIVLLAMGDFKTISQSSKEQIQGILKGVYLPLEKVQTVEQPLLEIKQEPVEVATDTAPKETSVRY